jgi:PilZ domain-containing protein
MSPFQGEERRRSSRLHLQRPVLIYVVDGDSRPVTAFTFSVSAFGCAVRSNTNLPPGTLVLLECDGKKFAGRVSFVLKNAALSGFELGIAFEKDGSDFWGEKFDQ